MARSTQEAQAHTPGITEATKVSTQGQCTVTGDPPQLEGSVKDTIQVKQGNNEVLMHALGMFTAQFS